MADGRLSSARAALAAVGVTAPHVTTVLAAAALQESLGALGDGSSRATVLDVGAGTGALAALAESLGARSIGVERDAALVSAGRILYPRLDLVVGEAPEALPAGPFSVVVANLTDPPLRTLVPELVRRAEHEVIVTGVRLWQGPSLRRAVEAAALRRGLRGTTVPRVSTLVAGAWCGYRLHLGRAAGD